MNKTERIEFLIMLVDILLKSDPSKYIGPHGNLLEVTADASRLLRGIEEVL